MPAPGDGCPRRRRAREQAAGGTSGSRDSAIEQDILTEERNAALRATFAELPPRWKQLLSMLISEPPYSYAEISATLRIPAGSIGPLRGRCLARMRISSAFIGAVTSGRRPRPR
jgi:DNA-directed RNA polymerase specialized sigma24 family protein